MIDLFDDPTACRMQAPILGFFNEYRFLSNFHLCPCEFNNIIFPSSEHVYMYQKSFDPEYRTEIIFAPTPKDARNIGQTAILRRDWNTYRKTAMLNALRSKFANEPELSMLLATSDAYLEETNTWGDIFWGICQGKGENNLGKLLMKIRDSHHE